MIDRYELLVELRSASEALMDAYGIARDANDEALARRIREVGAQVAALIGECRPRPAQEKTS